MILEIETKSGMIYAIDLDKVGMDEISLFFRSKAGITKAEASRRSGVSHSYLSQMESGKRGAPSFDVLARIFKAYEIEKFTFIP